MYEEKEIKYKKRKKEKKTKPKNNNFNFIKKQKATTKLPKIQWHNILIKLITLLIIMILIIFIISRINKSNEEKNKIFNNNINTIIDATIKFYSANNLPHNVGDSTSLILEEMLEKKLIDHLEENKENTYDTKDSYIILTKVSNDTYHLKIYLSGNNQKKYIENDLICNEKCHIKK